MKMGADFKIMGIDVSRHNGNIDWNILNKNIDFVIIRAGYGKLVSQKDPKFEENYAKTNLHVGAYWYSYAKSVEEAKLEAKACLEVIKGKKFDMPIYFDIEEPSQAVMDKKVCSAIVRAFCSELEKANYWTGVYSYNSFFKTNLDDDIRKRYATWIARVPKSGNSIVKPDFDCGIHQYSFKGHVAGILGDVDLDICYIDYPKLIKEKKFNGYGNYTIKATQNGLTKDKAEETATYLRKLGMVVEII